MYKAIIFDLDGTAIPNRKDGMPSSRLIGVISKIKNEVAVSVATGRPIFNCREILKSLGVVSPCIIAGGAQIIDPQSETVLWQKFIAKKSVQQVIDAVNQFDYQIYFSNEVKSSKAREKLMNKPENIIYIMAVSKRHASILLKKFKKITDIVSHSVPSWTPDHFDIHITHKEATKKYALELLLKMIKVKKNETVGFGDGDNDLPIFEIVGYKVAMENGSDRLKKIADEIAFSAEKDGVARVIERLFSSRIL